MAEISASDDQGLLGGPRRETSEYHARATEQYARWSLDLPNSKRCGSPLDYTADACNQVVMLMGMGHSLMAAAGAMGVSPETINRWRDTHKEFRDAVSRGRAARVLLLESQMLASDNSAVINAPRLALANAAPEEWREKPIVDSDKTAESPIRLLAKQISGNAIRPRMPEPKVIEQELAPQHAIRPQQNIITDEVDHVVPRIHTISSKIYEDEDPEGAL